MRYFVLSIACSSCVSSFDAGKRRSVGSDTSHLSLEDDDGESTDGEEDSGPDDSIPDPPDTDTGGAVDETADSGLQPTSCGAPFGVESTAPASRGDELPSTSHVSFCVSDSEVVGWFTLVWWTEDGSSVVCHQGWEVSSSSREEFSGTAQLFESGFTVEMGAPVLLDGDCSQIIDLPDGGQDSYGFHLSESAGDVFLLDDYWGWESQVGPYGSVSMTDNADDTWSVELRAERSVFVVP